MALDVGGHSDIGGRRRNEDRWSVAPDGRWAMVSDGVGGVAGGDVAAEVSVAAASAAMEAGASVAEAIDRAHRAVLERRAGDDDAPSMSATLTIAREIEPGRWEAGAVGDSPAFVVDGSARQLLAPHTLAEALVASGVISRAESRTHPGRHRVTRCVGHSHDAEPDVVEFALTAGACVVLASDGIDAVPPDSLPVIVRRGSAADAAAAVVQAALHAGAQDNVTVVVVRSPT